MKTILGKLDHEIINKKPFYKELVALEGLPKIDWLKWRQKGIGSTDISAVCGINPFRSGLALYYDKIEEIKEETDQFKALEEKEVRMAVGIWNEPHLRELFSLWFLKNEGMDITIEQIPYLLQHPTNKIALTSTDGRFYHPEKMCWCLTEIKTTGEYNKKDWEDDNVPDYYYTQCQWEMYVTGYLYCYLVFLIGNHKFNVKLIKRNEEVIKEMAEKADYFWNTFVIPKVPPAPDGTESSKETLAKLYPKEEEGKVITITDTKIETCLKNIDYIKEEIKNYTKDLESFKQTIKAKMGDAEIAICGDRKITWKEVFRKEYIVKASSSRQFRILKNKEVK